MNKNVLLTAALAIIVFSALAGFLVYQNRRLSKGLAPSPIPTTITQTISDPQDPPQSPVSTSAKLTLSEIWKNIEASLNTKNYQAISTFMTNPVSLLLMSTECCGEITVEEAINQLDYIKGAEPFNFNQQDPLISNLKAKNERLKEAFVGISKGGEQLAAFTIDSQNKIWQIELSVSHKLYNQ